MLAELTPRTSLELVAQLASFTWYAVDNKVSATIKIYTSKDDIPGDKPLSITTQVIPAVIVEAGFKAFLAGDNLGDKTLADFVAPLFLQTLSADGRFDATLTEDVTEQPPMFIDG